MAGKEQRFYLQDYPVVYMTDVRSHWEDFRKAIKDISLAWGLKGWISTVVVGGPTWKDLRRQGLLTDYNKKYEIAEPDKKEDEGDDDDDEKQEPQLDEELQRALGLTDKDQEYFQLHLQFVDTMTWERESKKRLPASQVMGLDGEGFSWTQAP